MNSQDILAIKDGTIFAFDYLPSFRRGSKGLPSQRRARVNSMTNSNTSEPLEIYWQVFEASSTRILTCAIFDASGPGVELRVGYFGDSPLRSQMMPDIESARVLAQSWLDAARAAAKGNGMVIPP